MGIQMEKLVSNEKKVGERMESISIIGGADGPTEIFIAGNVLGVGWLNFFGVILVILLMIPNLIYLLIVAGILFGIGHLYVTMKDFEK